MRLTVAAVLVVLAVPAFAGPFGFDPGLSKEQIEAKVGKLEVTKTLGVFRTTRAPTPLLGMESYTLVIGKKAGLCKVIATGQDLETSVYGTALRSAYDDLKAALIKKYGEPSSVSEKLSNGSIWREPKEFMMGLKLDQRSLGAVWIGMADPVVSAISLKGAATSTTLGYLSLAYELKNFDACVTEFEAVDSGAL